MEHGSGSLGSLILVVTISFLVPILLYQLRLRVVPVVVAEIAAGLLIGKSGFNLVGHDPWVELLSLLGFIYLMFLSGVEIDFNTFVKKDKMNSGSFHPLSVAIFVFIGIFMLAGILSLVLITFGLVERAFLMTLIIGTISLGVVVPVLKERKLLSTSLGQILLLVAVLADLFTMILLAFYVSFLSRNMSKLLLLLLFFLLVLFIYVIVKRFATGKVFKILGESSIQFGTRAIFTLILVIVFLSESLGVESILGAFLAGIIVSLLQPKKEFIHQLESFGYGFLIPIFFVMVGAKLDLKYLFADLKILLTIPLLMIVMFLAKIIPMLLLKKWFSWQEVLSSGILLSSTLSLVIAAATLALDLHVIGESLHSALILVAILTCLLFPVLFNKLAPKPYIRKKMISIIGLNHISMPVAQDFIAEDVYRIQVFTASDLTNSDTQLEHRDPAYIHHIPILNETTLKQHGAFDADIVVIATMDDAFNIQLANKMKTEEPDKRLLVRIEAPEAQADMAGTGLEVFSTLFAARTVLRALIDSPGALKLITEEEGTIFEVQIHHLPYRTTLLRQLPRLENILILRIYRGQSYLIPHGNTEIRLGDRLLISGNAEQIEAFREMVT
ncbi:monovalent cation:proton antiporter family protein [Paenibacillus sp. CGMCC 1.16610]|uniref:Sodium:proton antiporter n=1 Tax=Paenibacillus anseongense TaxID=2682845 RepID=A0ABW9UJF2_9BACL|nr:MULTISPECIES: cation:proton antiporter [Paenibacillus]MBA2939806.1 monovalent cation:proton antiporter family protein [Paenibacillus sp. CGMCC 1.16610]MVQ39466.1 sodium:proton antiporter [Paenibacillus anseongense]